MNKTTFIVSDETVNCYGFVVLTSGIDTAQFERNPIMLYMHNRESGVVGRWENIRKDGKQLLADAVFDDSTELAANVKKQVENGFLRCASIGIDGIKKQVLNGVETVVSCRLVEISIVDLPGNTNAVKLFKRSGGVVYRLADLDETQYMPEESDDLQSALISLLGLDEGASDAEILQAVKNALEATKNGNVEEEVNNAVSCGYIDSTQRDNFVSLAKGNYLAFAAFINTQKQTEEPQIANLVREAANKGKIIPHECGIYERIGKAVGVKGLKELLFTLRTPFKPMDIVNPKSRDLWTLNDYRKFAPEELKNNPELYARLAAKEKGEEPVVRTLEWYRKNDPEYLRKHPDLYMELLEKEQQEKK